MKHKTPSVRISKGGRTIDFVTLASHALRTPISATKWYLEILRTQKIGTLNARQLDFLGEAYRANERMVHIINDLLLVVRIQEGGLALIKREMNMGMVFRDIIKELTAVDGMSNKIIYNYCYPTNIPKMLADVEKIKQVVRNLIMNAIEYTPSEGGVITIGCERKGKTIVYSVTDTGVGISRKDFKNIFKKFFRSKHVMTIATDGLGLGLFIAKSIIEAHGGSIWFVSEEGKGSTFYFSLPLNADRPRHQNLTGSVRGTRRLLRRSTQKKS